MAYNVEWGYIAQNASFPVCYLINNGQDFGAQYAQGSPDNPGGDLVSDGHEKILESNGQVVYCFQLTNNGTATFYKLEGGGLS